MSDIKMTEIEQLITNVNSDLCMFNRTSEANTLSLITTIESQKEEIQRLLAVIAEKEDEPTDYFDREPIASGDYRYYETPREEQKDCTHNSVIIGGDLDQCTLCVSQKEEIEQLKREKEVQDGIFSALRKQAGKDIQIQRAITELAVKGLKEIKYSPTGLNSFQIATSILAEFERLSQ